MNILYLVIIFIFIAASFLFFAFLIYRLPKPLQQKCIEGEIVFVFIDKNTCFRHFLETVILRNKVVTLADNNTAFYVNANDYKKLWKVSPHKLSTIGNTYKLRLITTTLLFGGYGLSTVENMTEIDKKPIIVK
ncbi:MULTISPECIES: hypothetical protein [Pseudoalteromonas]|uniref:hypothetical protein n=1 Tax=Pseudoalteromonas TaxID=53246 RepID=UPI000462FE53|nr:MULTISPECIES: hypothetical protein [unclassified Pseudoalteromonas]MBB1305104.1 hypothetical protein [Pseudoalteromonas sp. SR43-5]MBB1326021.1 hypothetical protein [Pseudoalteromonas sp. SR45-1]MBB1348745.1 hypothetical protein [Pseudoalteromonas sp. SG45-3]MBB1358262.1 hypothetical protein [Pseudoalteromonas sp. SG45-6]MBB1430338.1 hypothetical protein [Pseudoalteromonas sp. SG43-4]